MSKPRPTRGLAAVCAAAVLVLSVPAHAGGATAARRAAPPTVGECRSLTAAQADAASDTSAPIDCAAAHTSRVIAVPSLPTGVTYADLDTGAKIARTATRLCYPAFRAAVGQSDRVRSRTAYAFLFFIPTAQERTDGARWLRCDLALQHGKTLGVLPTYSEPALTDSTIPVAVKRCLAGKNHLVTTCKATHSYRATGSFTVDVKRFPGRKRIVQIGRNRCPALVSTDRDFLFSWMPQPTFDGAHDHALVCFSHTSS